MLRTVLIVDDSPISRTILKRCLPPDHGFTLLEACDGAQGLEVYTRERPDLVFLDLTMPVMDGFQALQAIRLVNRDALVVIATADVQVKTLSRVLNAGALTLLRKPVSPAAVADALRQADEKARRLG